MLCGDDLPLLNPSRYSMRHYQESAIQAALKWLYVDGHPSGIIQLATGLGKTAMAGELIRRCMQQGHVSRALFLAHRDELITQAMDCLEDSGLAPGREQGSSRADSLFPANVVVATVQTLRNRMEQWPKDEFQLIITDECFPAGTLIDGRPIETIRPGDLVMSFNESTWSPELRPVVRLFKRKPSGLVRVHLDNGSSIVCTPEHPVFASDGGSRPSYAAAKDLLTSSSVYSATPVRKDIANADHAQDVRGVRNNFYAAKLEREHGANLLGIMQSQAACGQSEGRVPSLHGVRNHRGVSRAEWTCDCEEGPSVLLRGVQEKVLCQGLCEIHCGHEPQVRLGPNEGKESDARSSMQGEGQSQDAGDRSQASRQEGQRSWADRASVDACDRFGMGDGSRREDGDVESRRKCVPTVLQGGHCQCGPEGCDRSGRAISRDDRASPERSEEKRLSPVARVVRVEILEPGCDGQFGGMCPGGHVFNIEVEGNHNYFANGILVHNCHRSAGATYQNIYNHYSHAKLIGITATIDRADKKGLDRHTEVVYRYSLMDAIGDPLGPFLAPVQLCRIDMGADLRKVSTIGKRGDFEQGELGRAIEPYIEKFANSIADEIGDRKSIVFMPCVNSAMAMASALNQLDVRTEWVSGERKGKREIVKSYKQGQWQVIVNCDMLGEGFDDPATECVVLKPTRSRIAYAQMVGRGTRMHPGKTHCMVIDFNHTTDLDLIGPGSLAELDAEVAKEVTEVTKKEKGISLWDAVERAKETVEKRREEISVRVARLKQTYRKVVVDPFEAAANLGVLTNAQTFTEDATDKQVALLAKWGIATSDRLTKRQASRMISAMIERRKAGLCSLGQLNTLISLGVKPYMARNMTFDEARSKLDELFRNR